MKFRILSGKSLCASLTAQTSLSSFYSDDELSIELDKQAASARCPNGNTVICIGNVYGKRNEKGLISAIDSLTTFLSNSLNHMSLIELAHQLEGRFILIQLNTDGICDVCADQFSKVEVFIQQTKGGVALVSDLSLLPEDPSALGFDQAALAHTLTYYGYCPPKKHTIYKGVRRLGVGELATIENGEIKLTEKLFVPAKSLEYSECKHDEYSDLFLNHLKEVGSEEGNVVYLSSGWDSTAILAGLVHVFGSEKVRCVTGRMMYSERSGVCNQFEIDRAKKMADYFKVRLDFVDFEYLEEGHKFVLEMAPTMKDNHLYSLNCISHGKLAEKTKEITTGNEIVFAGEISDGAHNLGFSQYATIFHPSYGFREYSDKMASYMFGSTFFDLFSKDKYEDDPIYKLFRSRSEGVKFDAPSGSLEERPLQILTSFFLRNGRMPLWSLDNVNLLTPKGREFYTQEMQDAYLKVAADEVTVDNIYAWYLHLYNSFHWQGSTVRTLPVLAERYGLQTDMPYWDAGIQKFLSEMPEDWGRGLDLNPTKYPLKMMLKNKIDYPYEFQTGPHAYTYDVDHSFNHLEEVFCHSKLKGVLQDALRNKPYHQILSRDVFNMDYIDNLVEDYVEGKTMELASLADIVPIAVLCLIGWYGKE